MKESWGGDWASASVTKAPGTTAAATGTVEAEPAAAAKKKRTFGDSDVFTTTMIANAPKPSQGAAKQDAPTFQIDTGGAAEATKEIRQGLLLSTDDDPEEEKVEQKKSSAKIEVI